MSINVVNGCVCTSGCDEAKVKQGKDPNALPGTPPGVDSTESGLAGQPATVLGGVLADLADAVSASSDAATVNNDTRSPCVNLLV